MHPAIALIAAAGLFVALGGFVQSGVGLGLGLIGAPVVTLLDPALMPGAMLVAGASLPALILARELLHADWPGVSWALAGRMAGTVGGIWVLAVVSLRALGIVIGGMVLAVVALSAREAVVPRNRVTLVTAGVISGVTGTATSIGGPPVALLYQNEAGPRVRATLSVFFSVGNSVALAALAVTGHLPGRDVLAGLVFAACAAAGFVAAAGLRRFLDAGRTRTAVLAAAAGSALILIVHSVLG
jgi:uncharacterized membrane protein YfcA